MYLNNSKATVLSLELLIPLNRSQSIIKNVLVKILGGKKKRIRCLKLTISSTVKWQDLKQTLSEKLNAFCMFIQMRTNQHVIIVRTTDKYYTDLWFSAASSTANVLNS